MRFFFVAAIIFAVTANAQEVPPAPLANEEVEKSPVSQCLEPPPVVRFEDYTGPFAKIAGSFARKLENRTVHAPHYKSGVLLCSLEPRTKFMLFVWDSIEPASFVVSGFNAGLSQLTGQEPSFGQGVRGLSQRFGADLAGRTAGRFFGDFLYPTIFSEDPRYYRMMHGSTKGRLLHAMRHTVVAHRDDGRLMFNFTEWLGTASSVALNNAYRPDTRSGVAAAARGGAYSVLQDMGFDVLREFWPELARAFKMPFRGIRDDK